MLTYWLNGEFRQDPESVDISDRGLLLGDGLFETVLVIAGVPAFLKEHMSRLRHAAGVTGLCLPSGAFSLPLIGELLARNGLAKEDAVLRLTVTRGGGGRGLVPLPDTVPTLLMTVLPRRQPADTVATLMVSSWMRHAGSVNSRFKTLNYLDNIMARREASAAGSDDALMLNACGYPVCTSVANIFVMPGPDTLLTPPVSYGALPGIVRGVLLGGLDAIGIRAQEMHVTLPALRSGTVLTTNSLTGVQGAFLPGGARPDAELLRTVRKWYTAVLMEDLGQTAGKF